MGRRILSVLAGFALWSVLWVGLGAGAQAAFPGSFAEDGSTTVASLLLGYLGASVVISLLAGWTTGRLAPEPAMKSVWILAVIQLGIGTVVQLQWWETLPLWYHVPFLVLLLPAHVMGGLLATPGPRTRTA